jgi:hypothetical protein
MGLSSVIYIRKFIQGDDEMRLLLGIIVGAALTISVAYISDSLTNGPALTSTPTTQQRTMVNWDVVGDNWQYVRNRIQDEWIKRTG